MRRARAKTKTRGFGAAALPIAAYLAITLAVPAARGAAASDAFGAHALQVVAVTAAVLTGYAALAFVRSWVRGRMSGGR